MNIEKKINKLEQELNELKKQAKNCKPTYWKPKNYEKFWFIDGRFIYKEMFHEHSNICGGKIVVGNFFRTKEEAEKELELILATQRLKEAIWEANGGEFIGFRPDVLNITINAHNNILRVDYCTYTQIAQDWMYIKDKETAEKVLKENRKDFKIYYDLN